MADLQVDPQEAAQVAADLQDVHAVLETCGMSDLATRTRFITLEGLFLSLDRFSILVDDNDVTSMAARMSRRTVAEGKIMLGRRLLNVSRPSSDGGSETRRNEAYLSWRQTSMLT